MKRTNTCRNRGNKRWTDLLSVVVIGLLLVTGLLSGCSTGQAKVYHVGILSGSDAFLPVVDGFKAQMTELGYIEGQNVIYDSYGVNMDAAEAQRILQKFVADKVDLIFTVPTEPSVEAQAVTQGTDIPVIFAYAGIEGSSLVKNVREPGGNITGVRFPGPEQISKRLEILIEIMPQVKRVWIGYDQDYPNTAPALAALRPLASSRGITLVEVPAASEAELEADLQARAKLADPGMDAILLMPDTFNHSPSGWAAISSFATEKQIPMAGSFLYTVEQGAIFGNANDLYKVGQLAAPLADKIFHGTAAGTIPVVSPEQELWINYTAAQALGLTVPEDLLGQAAKIIR